MDGPEVSEGARARAPYVFLAAAEAGEGMRMARGYGRVCAAENLFVTHCWSVFDFLDRLVFSLIPVRTLHTNNQVNPPPPRSEGFEKDSCIFLDS